MRRFGWIGSIAGILVVAELALTHVTPFAERRLAQGTAAFPGLVALPVLSWGPARDALLLLCSLSIGFVVLEGVAVRLEPPGSSWMDARLRGARPIVG